MSKWTPGPWAADRNSIRGNDGALVADAWSGISAERVDVTGAERGLATVANARLIAAAPEMAEALEGSLDLVPRVSDDDPMAPALADWCRGVRALLARINGD